MLSDDKRDSDVTRPSEFAPKGGDQGGVPMGEKGRSGGHLGDIEPLAPQSGEARFLAHYEILEMIGQGGMGTVYKAKDTLLDRQVAVKVLSAHLSHDTELQDRFVREAKIIARMAHPNLPQIHFIGRAEGQLFFAMEWIDGETLDALSKRGRVPPEKVLDIASQAASGLEVAHRAGIIHRDIKPSNIMLTSEGVAKILDFGIARSVAIDSGATMTAGFVGTPDYASPEQARGEKVDERSDIYSLGATLYRLMSGKPPFEHETPLGILTRRLVDPVPELPGDVKCAPEVRQLIRKMMARDPGDRYQTSAELLAEIHGAYPGPVVAAGLVKRTFAFLTDLLLVAAPIAAIGYLFLRAKGYFLTTLLYDSIPGRIALGLSLLIWLVGYFVLVPLRWRATPGQRIQGIRLAARDGSDATLRDTLVRVLVFWGPVCLAMAIQSDWPPVATSRGIARGEPSIMKQVYHVFLLPNLPWVVANLWCLHLGIVALVTRHGRNLADWLSDTGFVEREKRYLRPGSHVIQESTATARFDVGGAKFRPAFDLLVILAWVAVVGWVIAQRGYEAKPLKKGIVVETVRKGDSGWNRLLARFSEELLTQGDRIENPEVLVFQRRVFRPTLWANTSGHLFLRSNTYGVRVSYDSQGMAPFAGGCGFVTNSSSAEEIQPADEAEARRWDENRRQAYRGSYVHFLRALMHRRLAEEGFKVLNPEAFVGLFRRGDGFVLVASPNLRVQTPPNNTIGGIRLYHGWLDVSNDGSGGGAWEISGAWGWLDFMPSSVLARYAEEQDRAWGEETSAIQQVVSLE